MSIEDRIKKEITENKIVLYMKGTPEAPQCGFSATTAQCLDQLGVKYHTVNILDDVEIRQGIKKFSNWPTIPQLYINGKFIGGCDITKELFASGELKKLVEG
ncbi:MAG: Grx4 family monothiol glutaredoxin [Deltaproteobacteria bacterium]|nr:Grx4 family monothiol glutaredoxin [Deltaproteobacteria bacterium]